MVNANEELLKQVWINLLDNAIKLSPVGGTLEVAILQEGEGLQCPSLISGRPFPLEKRARIFNKFYQADESHAPEDSGVGLAIVKRPVKLHGGEACVKSEDGATVFTVKLPQ